MTPAGTRTRALAWLSVAALTLASAVPALIVQMRVKEDPRRVAPAAAAPERMAAVKVAELDKPTGADALTTRGALSLYAYFAANGYTLETVRGSDEAVPRVFLAHLPRDLPNLVWPELRKAVFIKMMLPLILAENERIRADRSRALTVRERLEDGRSVPRDQLQWLADLADRYGVDDGDLDELFRRVDVISPSLALAQAALETGWGTSAVAQRGHAMFGQMVFRLDGEAQIGTVKTFDCLAAAIEAYAHNLNTHRAYAELRARRSELRRDGLGIDGHELALQLGRYSERKLDYVRDVRGLIRTNNLQPFDRARLGG